MNVKSRFVLQMVLLIVLVGVCGQFTGISARQQGAVATRSNTATAAPNDFYLHNKHVKELGFDCNSCHLPTKEGSVSLNRPRHDQCNTCHADAFDKDLNQ